jgi:hypothetical protein
VHDPIQCQDDGLVCTLEGCDPRTGECARVQVLCGDGNPCTLDYCVEPTGCVHDPIQGCTGCQSDEDCADDSLCTEDTCNTNTGECSSSYICSPDQQCIPPIGCI